MNQVKKTQATYQQIAAVYAEAQKERGHLLGQLEKFAGLVRPSGVVLDVGCGPGWDTAILRSLQLTAFGLDFSPEMMRTGRDVHQVNTPFAQADMRRLPVGAQVDGLWVCASMLHLERADVLPTLREFHRVLKPGGILYLSVKRGRGEQWVSSSYGQPFPRFYTYWQPEALDALLETAVFQIIDGWQETVRQVDWLIRYARKEEPDA